MDTIKKHITFKILTVLLTVALLSPTVTKFAHMFVHHKHDICLGEKTTHLHELNTDCDFYKFKLSIVYNITFFNFNLLTTKEQFPKIVSQYQFLSKYQRLHTKLRGPPAII